VCIVAEATKAGLSAVYIVVGVIVAAVMLAVFIVIISRLNCTRRCTPCELDHATLLLVCRQRVALTDVTLLTRRRVRCIVERYRRRRQMPATVTSLAQLYCV